MPSWTATLALALLASSIGSQASRWLEWFNLPRSQRTLLKSDTELLYLENSLRSNETQLLNSIRTGWTAGTYVRSDSCFRHLS